MQASARNTVCHIAAELSVGRAGVHIDAACPVAERVDLRAGELILQVFGVRAALADDEPVTVENVFTIRGVSCEDFSCDLCQRTLLVCDGDASEDAVVAAAHGIRLISCENGILCDLMVVYDHVARDPRDCFQNIRC